MDRPAEIATFRRSSFPPRVKAQSHRAFRRPLNERISRLSPPALPVTPSAISRHFVGRKGTCLTDICDRGG
jgi:hypothetical protein